MEPVPSSRHTWIAKSPPALGLLFCALVGYPWKLNVHMCCTASQTSGYSATIVWIRSRPPSGGDRVPRLMHGSPCVAQAAAPSSHHSCGRNCQSHAQKSVHETGTNRHGTGAAATIHTTALCFGRATLSASPFTRDQSCAQAWGREAERRQEKKKESKRHHCPY